MIDRADAAPACLSLCSFSPPASARPTHPSSRRGRGRPRRRRRGRCWSNCSPARAAPPVRPPTNSWAGWRASPASSRSAGMSLTGTGPAGAIRWPARRIPGDSALMRRGIGTRPIRRRRWCRAGCCWSAAAKGRCTGRSTNIGRPPAPGRGFATRVGPSFSRARRRGPPRSGSWHCAAGCAWRLAAARMTAGRSIM